MSNQTRYKGNGSVLVGTAKGIRIRLAKYIGVFEQGVKGLQLAAVAMPKGTKGSADERE